MKKGGVVGVLHRLRDTTNLRIGTRGVYHSHGHEYRQSPLSPVNLLLITIGVIDMNQELLRFDVSGCFLLVFFGAQVLDAAQLAGANGLVDRVDDLWARE